MPGRLLLDWTPERLLAANTGAPLAADGVAALASLRASAKRVPTPGRGPTSFVGRFGVGFAAVLALTDQPAIGTAAAAVRFSRSQTAAEVRRIPSLSAELAARGGHVPALRLPWPESSLEVPEGYDTSVMLPFRDAAAAEAARTLLSGLNEAVLLALPWISELVVRWDRPDRWLRAVPAGDGVELEIDGRRRRWRRITRSEAIPPHLLAERPAEEQGRRDWSLTWALPLAEGVESVPAVGRLPDGVPRVLHVPTPSDEPLGLPALLIGTFPVDSSRRHVVGGPLADFLVERSAALYAELAGTLAADGVRVAALVPAPLPAGALDARLRAAVVASLRETALLPALGEGADPSSRLRIPRKSVAVEAARPELLRLLARWIENLVDLSGWPAASARALGVEVRRLGDVIDDLAGAAAQPAEWKALYAALAGAELSALATLPVPLADGRTVRGARGTLLADLSLADVVAPLANLLGLRVVHPDAADPLLERLGAQPVTPAVLLSEPSLRRVVADEEFPDADALADAVLGLVAVAEGPQEGGDLDRLRLRSEYGDLRPARELVLPASVAEDLLELARVAPATLQRWGPHVLRRAGVLADLRLARVEDVALVPAELEEFGDRLGLPDLTGWADLVLSLLGDPGLPPEVSELAVVADLDVVAGDAWPGMLARLSEPDLRPAVVEPVTVAVPEAGLRRVPSATAWLVRDFARVGGLPLTHLRFAGSDERLADLYRSLDLTADPAVLAACGVRTSLDALLAEPTGPRELLDRLLDAAVPAHRLREIYATLAATEPARVPVPGRLRVPVGADSAVVDAASVVVADAPYWLQLRWPVPPLVVRAGAAAGLARVLDLDLASDVAPGRVQSQGRQQTLPRPLAVLLPAGPQTWWEHEALVVDGEEVDWWVDGLRVHAATSEGLALGLAWASGQWSRRWLVEAALLEPERLDELMVAEAFE